MKENTDIRLFLDDIRSVHNAGSIFRTAETVGVSRVYCAGTTSAPVDRFGRKRADFAKVALGAEDMLAWEQVESAGTLELIKNLKKEGFRIVALEQAADSIDYRKVKAFPQALVILGNEVGGVSKGILELADEIAEIPLKGKKESLNVSVAAGVFLFRLYG